MGLSKLSLRITGFVFSVILTLLTYFIIVNPKVFGLNNMMSIASIIFLAAVQGIIQLIFFLDLAEERKPRWNLWFLLSTIAIIFVVIWFSMWIIDHLNANMMPGH